MANEAARLHILQMIEDGKITADEGLRLINAMSGPEAAAPDAAETASTGEAARPAQSSPDPDPKIRRWQQWWLIPMSIGVGIILLGGLWMYSAYQSTGIGLWFFCASIPFLFGVVVAALAWSSRHMRWVHIRVDTNGDEKPRRIAISLPLPLGWVAWGLRTFGDRIPNLSKTAVDELLVSLAESTTPDAPIFVDVDEGEKGERVQVYIG
ncbi:MAG TPA: hypothetical protein VI547_11450 [Anaerolineales bacterium]|nr:hypothetical protein [Anaerolineales bacterium]